MNKIAVRYQSETAELPLIAGSGDRHALPGRNLKGMVKWGWSNILDPTLEPGIASIHEIAKQVAFVNLQGRMRELQ